MLATQTSFSQYHNQINSAESEDDLNFSSTMISRDSTLTDNEFESLAEAIEIRRRRLKVRIPTKDGRKLDILYTNDANQKLIDKLINDPLAGISNTPPNLPSDSDRSLEDLPYLHYEQVGFDYLRAKVDGVEPHFEQRILNVLFPERDRRKLLAKIYRERGICQWDVYNYYWECQQTKALALVRKYLALDKDKLSPQVFFWLLNEFPWLVNFSCFQEFCKEKITVCVEMPGKFLRDLVPIEQIRLAQKLNELGFKATRIDIKCDFSKELGLFNNFLEYYHNERITRTKTSSYHESKEISLEHKLRTIYLGSRKSGKFIRIYEKPFDNIIVDRFEGEFKSDDALGLWETIISFTSDKLFIDNQGIDLQKFLARILFHLKVPYDIRRKRKNGQTIDIDYPEWFTDLLQKLNAVVPIKYVVLRPEKCISSTFQWIKRNSKTLHKYFVSCPYFLQYILNQGERKLEPKDKAEMNYLELVLPILLNLQNSNSSIAIP